jgi:hypothetical protein
MTNGNEKDEDPLHRWARIINRGSGYAGIFNSETTFDKQLVEASIVDEWRRSIAKEFSSVFDRIELNPNDPPDFYAWRGETRSAIELVQLVEADHKRRAIRGETPHAGQLFAATQWTKDRFGEAINQLLARKGAKYEKVDLPISALVIHTAEPWLQSRQVQEWLTEIHLKLHPNILSAYLLIQYEPGRRLHYWPVFRLY